MQTTTTSPTRESSVRALASGARRRWFTAAQANILACSVAACAVGDDTEQRPAINERAPVSETCRSVDTAPPCDRFLLRTSKSLTSLSSSYVFSMGSTRCDADETYGVETFQGAVEFQYRLLENPPDVPGYVDFSTTTWDQQGQFFAAGTDGSWRVEVDTLAHLGPGVASTAVQFRARPVDGDRNPTAVSWSEWVQVNHGTRYGLLRTTDYWSVEPTHDPLSYSGTNFARCEDFTAEIGWHEPDHYWRDGLPVPTTHANAVMSFTKSNRFGYHNPSFEWNGANDPLWDRGEAFNLFWVDTPQPYPADGNPYERWIMSNATEWHAYPADDNGDFLGFAGPSDATEHAFEDSPRRVIGDGSVVADSFFSEPAIHDPDLRNYMLTPEYVGQGWGIVAVHGPPHSRSLWAAHANIWRSDALPHVSGPSREVLQLKYYEGPETYLIDPNAPWGHREDWYFDTRGPLRIEGRSVGAAAEHGETLARRRVPGTEDPDLMYREVLKAPQYCMTRDGAGTCDLQRLSVQ